jgi:uncharacterized protein (DUF697 family)
MSWLGVQPPAPFLWLFGKAQSGKTSIVRFLTGAGEAVVGAGFRPCTLFSRRYAFPSPETPLLWFVDTRGLGDPSYDPAQDIAELRSRAHVLLVTVRAMDHAQYEVIQHLQRIRRDLPRLPVVLIATCLHEAYPLQQHPVPHQAIPWDRVLEPSAPLDADLPAPALVPLFRSLRAQVERFQGLFDRFVAIDFTRREDGFADLWYGGEELKEVLLKLLPEGYRHALWSVERVRESLGLELASTTWPVIAYYAAAASAVAAVPVPGVDLVALPSLYAAMALHLSRLYQQPLSGARAAALLGALGAGWLARQLVQSVLKVVPVLGSAASGTVALVTTAALGKTLCWYFERLRSGSQPEAQELRTYYAEQLARIEQLWRGRPEATLSRTGAARRQG